MLGIKVFLFHLKDEKRNGPLKMRYDHGGKKFEANYHDDQLHGTQIKYYVNGMKNVEVHYLHNIEHVKKTIWKENGEVLFEAEFVNGELI